MATLGEKEKKQLLYQLDVFPDRFPVKTLVEYITKYDNISIDDFSSLSPQKLMEVEKMVKKASAQSELNGIKQQPANTRGEIKRVLDMFPSFYQKYRKEVLPDVCAQAEAYEADLKRRIEDIDIGIERDEWNNLDKGNYNALRTYIRKYPNSVHRGEVDDLMWNIVNCLNTVSEYERYLADWSDGKHRNEAESIIKFLEEWETIEREKDIISVRFFLDQLPSNSSAYAKVEEFYEKLRADIIEDMRINPSNYPKEYLYSLISNGIFSEYELINQKRITKKLWDVLKDIKPEDLPNLSEFQGEDCMPPARNVCSDIYLFGTPGTGKTCLLMGLVGTNGQGFSLNMKLAAGEYAAALNEYVHRGFAPRATPREWIATICGEAYEKTKKGKIITHNINLVEMSGEQFAFDMVKKKVPAIAGMGTGASKLLSNKNRKCFFIVVDCSNNYISYRTIEKVTDSKTGQVTAHQRKYLISQSTILTQFVNLFTDSANQKIMDRVDAIHFVVTKADLLGDTQEERHKKARELLFREYGGPILELKTLCQRSKRINYATNYEPLLFTFSLGKFYVGNLYEFDPTDSITIMDYITKFTVGVREKSWWERFMEAIGD